MQENNALLQMEHITKRFTGSVALSGASIHVKRGEVHALIGAKGAMLKSVGTKAREEMEQMFGKRIFLELHVKAQPDWRENKAFLNSLDWRTMAGRDES